MAWSTVSYATVQIVASCMELTGALLQYWRVLVQINVVRQSPDILVRVMGNHHALFFSFVVGGASISAPYNVSNQLFIGRGSCTLSPPLIKMGKWFIIDR